MSETQFNVAHIEEDCLIYGPGTRTVIWLQGCSIHCKGCWNIEMWDPSPRRLIERQDLLDYLIGTGKSVTILGGEPLDQSENLLWLMKRLKKSGVNIMLYTGHEPEEIATSSVWTEICGLADILIPGRYKEEQRDITLRWRGSSNQPIISSIIDGIEDCNEVEIHIDEDGKIVCMGYPTEEMEDILKLDEDY